MKKFLVRLCLFLSPILVVVVFIEYSLSQVPNSYNKKKLLFEKQLDSIEVLITGNSQSLFAINPAMFIRKGFNVSNVSQPLYYDKEIILKYLPHLKNLRLVIIPIGYTSLYSAPLEENEEEWRCFYYKRFWDISNDNLSVFNPSNYSFIALYSWEETQKLLFKKFKVNLAEGLYPNGFMKSPYDNVGDKDLIINDSLGRRRVGLHDSIMNEKFFAENYRSLKKLVNELQEKKIHVVFITLPVYSTYYKFCNPDYLQKKDSVLNNLCTTYNLKYFDYFKDARFTKMDFRDNDHMSFDGASHFSNILKEEVINKVLSK